MSKCPSLQRCYFFPLFFPCVLSGIIKCCDCFGLPSMGIYPTHKYKSSSPEICFHSGRVVKVCSVRKTRNPDGLEFGSWLFSKTQRVLLRSIKICLLTLKIHSSTGIFTVPFAPKLAWAVLLSKVNEVCEDRQFKGIEEFQTFYISLSFHLIC